MPRTPSPSRSPGAASTPASRPSTTCRSPIRPASTAATASASARRERSCSRASTTCARPAPGTPRADAAANAGQPVKVDNDLYVRDYAKCIVCYKCVEACGRDAQNTFAIALAGRGFDARISTEYDVPLPDSACVYCGNCIGVCPTGALMFKSEHDLREAGRWEPERQTATDTICPYCGVGCTLTVHVQDERIVKVTSPIEQEVTRGHLCIKGRFGWDFVNRRE
jgi:NADP-reducing hydrogenase subunit HndD